MDAVNILWFFICFTLIAIVIIVDPKTSNMGSGSNQNMGIFSSSTSEQRFIYRLSAILIFAYLLLSLILNLSD